MNGPALMSWPSRPSSRACSRSSVTRQVEVGQPWRNAQAGLKDGDLAAGVELTVIGEPSADPTERRLKAERLVIGGRDYILYPDRS